MVLLQYFQQGMVEDKIMAILMPLIRSIFCSIKNSVREMPLVPHFKNHYGYEAFSAQMVY